MKNVFRLLVSEYFRMNAFRFNDKSAILMDNNKLSWKQLNENANRIANLIIARGFRPGDRIAILLHNRIEYLEIIIGLAKAGVTIVPINFRFSPVEIEYIMNHTEAKALILEEAFLEAVKQITALLTCVENRNYIVIGSQCPKEMTEYENEVMNASEHEPDTIRVDEFSNFAIMYTGGTSGSPKGIVRSNRSRVMFFLYAAIEFNIDQNGINLTAMPIFHAGGMDFSMLQLFVGGTICLMPHFDPENALKIIDTQKVTNFLMVPTMLNMIMNLPDSIKQKYCVTSVKRVITAGEPIPTRTKEKVMKYFKNAGLSEFYGSSEMTMATHLRPEDQQRKMRSVGKPMLGLEAKILDSDGKEVAQNEFGLIYSTGATLMDEYFKDPRADAKAFRGKWITVNDLGYMDDEGYFYVVDRMDEMIISGGENIYPAEVENILLKHPKIAEAAVFGVPDEKWGESLKAVVVVAKGESLSEETILTFCNGKLAKYKIPRSIAFWDNLPKSEAGKVLRREIRKSYISNLEAL